MGVKGIPYNLWIYSNYKAIGDKFGGLVEVCPDTSTAMDSSEVRVRVKGTVREGSCCEEIMLNNQSIWVEYRRIGDILEQSWEDLKPIFIKKDSSNNFTGNIWRRKVLLGVGDKEGEGLGGDGGTRGCDRQVESSQKTTNQAPRPTSHSIEPVVLASNLVEDGTRVNIINDELRTFSNSNSTLELNELDKEWQIHPLLIVYIIKMWRG